MAKEVVRERWFDPCGREDWAGGDSLRSQRGDDGGAVVAKRATVRLAMTEAQRGRIWCGHGQLRAADAFECGQKSTGWRWIEGRSMCRDRHGSSAEAERACRDRNEAASDTVRRRWPTGGGGERRALVHRRRRQEAIGAGERKD